MPSSGVIVAEEGNRRKGNVTADEMKQCVHDIISWFQRKADIGESKMASEDIEAMEKALDCQVPQGLSVVLEAQNGGLWFDEYKGLSSDEITAKLSTCESWDCWKSCYVPFAADVDDNMLVINTSDDDAVLECSSDGLGREVSKSLPSFIESYRDKLLSGNWEFVEDVGIVEKARK